MRRILLLVLAGLLTAGFEAPAEAQFRSGLVPPTMARRFGLEREWIAQVELDSGRTRVAHITQHVSTSYGIMIVDVIRVDNEDQKLATFTDRDLDAFGKPLGPEGAKKEAAERIAELQAVGVEAKAVTTVVPEITLYVVTDSGLLQAIDGETGATRWSISVGNADHPTFAAAANDNFVAAVNGVNLYVFNADDGRLVWRKRMEHAVGAGPAVSREYVHVPMVTGVLESHLLADPATRVRVYQSFGRALLQPVISPLSVIWATDRGFVYVGNADKPGVRFRLETQDDIIARPAWLPPNHVVGVSLDGDVYAVNEFTGSLIWRFSTGDPIVHAPVVVGDDVYAITENYILFRLSAQTGGAGLNTLWSTPNVREFLSASKDRLYCVDRIGRLTILDRASGGRIGSLPTELLDVHVLNEQTDRLFIGTSSGLLQCFREEHLEYPIIHVGPGTEAPAGPPQVKQRGLEEEGAEPMPAEDAPAEDPFGGGAAPANPFGAPADPFGGGAPAGGGGEAPANPFGADPFGGGAAAPAQPEAAAPADADPFGADPFGAP